MRRQADRIPEVDKQCKGSNQGIDITSIIQVSTPRLQLFASVFEVQEPVSVQALAAQLAVERLDERIVRRTVVSIEVAQGVPSSNAQTLQKIKSALEAAGIEFIGSPEDRPGIRIGQPKT